MQTKTISPKALEQILSAKFQKRFWSKVEIKGPNDCWIWKKSTACGYGQINISKELPRYRASQIAWVSHHKKPIPEGLYILHSCVGNRLCCNPAHLRAGTQLENIHDMIDQGRNFVAYGERCGQSKLTRGKVLEIIEMYSSGNFTQAEIGARFGVHGSRVSRIFNRKEWTHLWSRLGKI